MVYDIMSIERNIALVERFIDVLWREGRLDRFPYEPRTIQGHFRADGSMSNTG